MVVGLLMSVYESLDLLKESLNVWLKYRKNGKHKLYIALIHSCFQENLDNGEPIYSQDGTIEYLQKLRDDNLIDFFTVSDKPLTEHDSRNIPLNWLLDKKVDIIFSSAPDEYFTNFEINNILNFVEKNPFVAVFSINYKNLTFNKMSYVDGFCPKRIWRRNISSYKLRAFNYDDDAIFVDINNITYQDKNLSHKEIPRNIAHIIHETWLDNERSRKKVFYQQKRWGVNGCSFAWENNHLCFNKIFYQQNHLPLPLIHDL